MQALQDKKQRLIMNLQSYPYQRYALKLLLPFISMMIYTIRNEIESQIRQVDREIQQCHDQFGAGIDTMSYGKQIMSEFKST